MMENLMTNVDKVNSEQTVKTIISNLIEKAKNNDNTLMYEDIKELFNSINQVNQGALPEKVQDNLIDIIESLGIEIISKELNIEETKEIESEIEYIDFREDFETDEEIEENEIIFSNDTSLSFDSEDEETDNLDEDGEENTKTLYKEKEFINNDFLNFEDDENEDDEDYNLEKESNSSYIPDNVKLYLKQIGEYPLLTAEEELELAKDYAKTGNKEAKHKLGEHNLKLVVSIAKRYVGCGIDLLDLIQEGNIGLMTAIDRFDYKLGYRLTTYATWWIKQAIQRYIMNNSKSIRIPVHAYEALNKLNRLKKELEVELGREANVDELVEATGFSEEKVMYLLAIPVDTLSLESPVKTGEDSDSVLGDFVADNSNASIEDTYEDTERNRIIAEVLNTLTSREQDIIRKRFGFEGKEYTLEMIGQELGVTRERIRQVEVKALRKLRHPSKRRILDSYRPY